jgi:hypothetical protein
MSDLPPKPAPTRKTGLSPAQQKLQALREKAMQSKSGVKQTSGNSAGGFKAKGSFTKKTQFQRKAT